MNTKYYKEMYELEDKHWWHIAKREVVLNLIKKYCKKKNPEILDVGCGTGKNIETFSNLGTVYGIDYSKNAINFCKKRGLLKISLGNSERTTFKNGAFDLITALDVLEHTNDKNTISEIHRALKPEGIFILTVPAYPSLWSKWDEDLGHKRRYTLKNINKLLINNGFSIIKSSYFFSFIVIPAYILRRIKSRLYGNNYPSDFKIVTPLLNSLLLHLSKLEKLFFLKTGIPFGTSIVCVAKKL